VPPADPAQLTVAYYDDIVAAILNTDGDSGLEEREDGNTYRRATFPGVDASILIRADIASLAEEALGEPQPNADTGQPSRAASALYELTLQLDSVESALGDPSWRDSASFFLGADGVGIELGYSWGAWA
jgi:hypothetical protein